MVNQNDILTCFSFFQCTFLVAKPENTIYASAMHLFSQVDSEGFQYFAEVGSLYFDAIGEKLCLMILLISWWI